MNFLIRTFCIFPASLLVLSACGGNLNSEAESEDYSSNSGLFDRDELDRSAQTQADIAGAVLLQTAGNPRSVLSANLPVMLALDEGNGNVALDSGGAGNDGALIGAPMYSTDTPDGSSHSLRFDRLNDQIDLGALDSSGTQITLAAWVKAETFPGKSKDPHIISKTSGSALSKHIFMLSTVGAGSGVRLRARLRIGGKTATLRAAPGNDMISGQWYHTAATYDGVNLRLYLDGIEVGSRLLSGIIDQDETVSVSVGSRTGGGNHFHGLIDDVRILDEALTVPQLKAIVAGIPSNGPPVAFPETYTVNEDNPLTVGTWNGVLANDTDPEGDSLSSSLVVAATNGALALNSKGSFIYTPELDFSGVDSFVYRATDGAGFSDDTLVNLRIEAVNDTPIALDDPYTTAYESSLNGNVLENDTDVDGGSISAELLSSVQDGVLSFQPNGSFTYSPAIGFSGLDHFTYIATDIAGAASDEAKVTITVTGQDLKKYANTILSLPFEEGSGRVATDSSGQGNNGQLLGNPVYTTATGNGSDYALKFDGTDDSVDLGVLDVGGSELTLAAWFKAESFPGKASDSRLISKASGTAADSHVFMLSTVKSGTGVRLRARLRIGGQTRTLIADSGSELVTGRWYHSAFSYDGALMRIYLDGELVGSQVLSGEIDQDPAMSVAVGSQPGGGRHFDGSIDDALIVNTALDGAQLKAIVTGVGSKLKPIPVALQTEANSTEETFETGKADAVENIATTEDSISLEPIPVESQTEYNPPEEYSESEQTGSAPVMAAAIGEDPLAFPGAAGWAAETTTGGRGGRVVIVNSLANIVDPTDNIMTFREALTEINEPRIIVFSVAGLIDYTVGTTAKTRPIKLNNSDSSVTIACQSAPPPGVTLVGDGIVFGSNTNNVIMRHCRFRNSDPLSQGSADNSSCIRVHGTTPASNGEVQHNYILDHVSCMWAADDPVSFAIPGLSSETGDNMKDLTISNSIVSEGDADSLHEESNQIPKRYLHAMGAGCATAKDIRTIERCSLVGNFMAHNSRRNGRLWAVSEGELINNIIYNPHEVGLSVKARPGRRNHVDAVIRGNLVQLGPTSKESVIPIDLGGNTAGNSFLGIDDNYVGQYRGGAPELYDDVPNDNQNLPQTQPASPVLNILELAKEGSDHLRCIGSSRPRRDSHDQRVIDEFHQQTGQVGILNHHERDFSEYNTQAINQSWIDEDEDGMPDTWELKMGVDNASFHDLSSTYTNIEVFLNNLALCPSISFNSSSISLPTGTQTATIPYESNWESWRGGQTIKLCVNDSCRSHYDTENKQTIVAKGLLAGNNLVTITPIGVDGVEESLSASLRLYVGP